MSLSGKCRELLCGVWSSINTSIMTFEWYLNSDETSTNGIETHVWALQGDVIWTAILYGNTADTEIRHKLKLRSTTPGANNRMDITKMVSFDRTQGVATQITGGSPCPYTAL